MARYIVSSMDNTTVLNMILKNVIENKVINFWECCVVGRTVCEIELKYIASFLKLSVIYKIIYNVYKNIIFLFKICIEVTIP